MKNTTSPSLSQYLSQLDSNEKNKLYKRAAILRKLSQAKTRRSDDEQTGPRRSLDDFVLQLLMEDEREAKAGARVGCGTVVWIGLKTCKVDIDGNTVEAALRRSISVAIGDEVDCTKVGDGTCVSHVRPRRTVLSRPDVGNANVERVIASNIDTVVVVVSVVAPPLHPNIIDRYMVAVQRGGAKMLLAVNKCDLLNDRNRTEELTKLRPFETLLPHTLVSTETGLGIEDLKQHLAGQTCAFVGHSGVGKSSLINAVAPELKLLTGEVSEGYGRGTHTTTSSTLHKLKGGTCLIDTPGVRSFGLWDVSAEELRWYFPEFETVAADCRFRDCSHVHEPGCAVKEHVASGSLSRQRYEAYLRILTSL